jgi:hypothetical protein
MKFILCKIAMILSFFILSQQVNAQSVSCETLMRAIKDDADYFGEVGSFALLSSDFLKEVKAYEYDGSLFVIAVFKSKPGEFLPRSYVFCGVPSSNWNSFKNGFTGTYGERFHQYIIDYVCNCN